jgi:ERF superfamily
MLDAGIEFYTAFLGVQTELGAIKKNKKAGNWTYGDIDTIMDHLRELLDKYKLAICPLRFTTDAGVYLRTKVIHTPSLQGLEDVVPLPAYMEKEWDDQESGKNTSYHRRYALQVIFNLTFTNDPNDDDGAARRAKIEQQKSARTNVSSSGNIITPAQLESLKSALNLMPNTESAISKIKGYNKIDDLAQLTQSQFEGVMHSINKVIKNDQ